VQAIEGDAADAGDLDNVPELGLSEDVFAQQPAAEEAPAETAAVDEAPADAAEPEAEPAPDEEQA
jgi:small subunit ribosomal protein S1